MSKRKIGFAILGATVLLIIALVTSCTPYTLPETTESAPKTTEVAPPSEYIYEDGAIMGGGDGEPI